MKEPYEGSEYNYGKQYIAYSSCVLALLKILAKKENFKPEILHLTDWPVGFVTHLLNDSCHKDKFYKNMKTVMTIHNTGYQGKYDTFYAFLNLFEKDFIKETLSACNIQISENTIKNALQDFASIIKIFVRNSMIILKKDWTPITLTLTLSQKNDSIHFCMR